MKTGMKCATLAAAGLSLAALSQTASALVIVDADTIKIEYSDIITGPDPGPGTTDGSGNFAVATITNSGTGVDVALELYSDLPEFGTHLFFSLDGSYGPLTVTDDATAPDITHLDPCNGKDPAGTGFWQLCVWMDPADKANELNNPIEFFVDGLQVSNFAYNDNGWVSALHLQGIVPDCSAWVGDYDGEGKKEPGKGGECAAIPEPHTLSLLSLGLVSILGAGITNGRRRRRLSKA